MGEQQKIIDNLFWFYQYKRECTRYVAIHKANISKSYGEYFEATEPQSDKVFELSEKTLKEIKSASVTLPKDTLTEYFTIVQDFLNSVYDGMDQEYAERPDSNGMDLAFPRGIPSIQNFIRSESDRLPPIFKEPTPLKYLTLEAACEIAGAADTIIDALKSVGVVSHDNKFLGSKKEKAAVLACGNLAFMPFGLLKDSARSIDFGYLLSLKVSGLEVNSRSFDSKIKTLHYKEYEADLRAFFQKRYPSKLR
jgi:hypothetical protein